MRTIRDIKELENVRVLVRAALNVPVADGKVANAFRLKNALPTIEYLQKKHARVILIGHIGEKGTETLHPVFEELKRSIPRLRFCPVSVGPEAEAAIATMSPGDVLMLENLRRDAGETKNDSAFAAKLAALGDIFVQDSFDVCHRKHASVVGVPTLMPSHAGLLVEKEITELSKALKPKRPALAIIGGAKFSTKEPVLIKLLATYDHVFVGGALANDFLAAKGYDVGTSLVSKEGQDHIRELLKNPKLAVPVDVMTAPVDGKSEQGTAHMANEIPPNEAVLDEGPHTTAALTQLANDAKTILWNGPLGLFENGFTDATYALARAIAGSSAHSIIGGGDTIAAIEDLGLESQFSFISTGGGAMLDFLANGMLPGIEALT